jgi:hypothetical protein
MISLRYVCDKEQLKELSSEIYGVKKITPIERYLTEDEPQIEFYQKKLFSKNSFSGVQYVGQIEIFFYQGGSRKKNLLAVCQSSLFYYFYFIFTS